MVEEVLLTQEGFDKIKEEYEYAISVRRIEVAERLKEARSFGDLSENAEYDAAKEEQADLEERINKLEAMMRNAKIIEEGKRKGTRVQVGNTVELQQEGKEITVTYTIVGSTETDPINGKISNESAVGKAVIGAKAGDIVEIELPNGKTKYTIISFHK